VREIFVADTDAEAMKLSAGGMMGRMMTEYFPPLLAPPVHRVPQHKPDVPDSDVTTGVLRQAQLAVGRPATDRRRANAAWPSDACLTRTESTTWHD